MNFKKRFLAGALSLVLTAGTVLTGCGGVNKEATLVNINSGEAKISLGLYNFAAKYQQSLYDVYYASYFGDDMWNQDMGSAGTMEDSVKKDVLDTLENYYVLKAHAADYGVEITDTDKSAIADAAAKLIADNTKKGINQLGATEDIVKEYLEYYFYYTKVREKIEAETEINVSDDDKNQSTVSYFKYSIAPTTAEGEDEATPMSDEDKAAAYEEANLAMLNFDVMAEEEGSQVKTYSFTTAASPADDSTLGEKVITAALALEEGEVSEIIEVEDDAYYVVRMDKILDEDATATKEASLENAQRSEHYNEVLDSFKENLSWEVDENSLKQVKFKKPFSMNKEMEDAINSGN